jgi:phage terminase large subunit GpA-like protein
VHFPKWLGSWFYDELTYEERSTDGKWSKPGRGPNEAFDLLVYADALAILHGYEKSNGRMRLSGHGGKRGWRTRRRKLAKRHPRLLHRPLPETRKHGKAP